MVIEMMLSSRKLLDKSCCKDGLITERVVVTGDIVEILRVGNKKGVVGESFFLERRERCLKRKGFL